MVKIGDKVRFLNDVGGGIVRGFQGKNVVLVEDENGFDIPTLISEVVVIDTDNFNFEQKPPKATTPSPSATATPSAQATHAAQAQATPAPAPPIQREGADRLTALLAFVPANVKELSKTSFDFYLVNDCNYYLAYAISSIENASWTLRAQGLLEPNTLEQLQQLTYADLNSIERLGIQLIAFKHDRPFAAKPPVSVELRIDTTKFYKLHSFRESDFFDEPTLEYDIVREDRPNHPLTVNAQQLRQAMVEKEQPSAKRPARTSKPHDRHEEVVEIDLHAHELLDTTAGMSPADIKDYQLRVFREAMDQHLKEKGRRIVFIHGKGEGVLRQALIAELKHSYKNCTWQDASFQQYGFGATMVIIH